MLYLNSFDFKGNTLIVTIANTADDTKKDIESDEKIKEFISKNKVLGINVVCDTILLTEYNKELIKLLNKKGAKVGLKAHLRNWIEAEFLGNNAYEYGFSINGEKVVLKREYLLMQEIKVDITDEYKNEPKKYNDVPLEKYFFKGFVKETVQPTAEELKIEAERRRKAQEQYRLEQEQKKQEAKLKAKEERKAQRAEEKLREKELADKRRRELEAQKLQEKMRRETELRRTSTTESRTNRYEQVNKGNEQKSSGRKFRVPSPGELASKFRTQQFYKGFKILKNNESGELAIIYIKEKPIYCNLIKGYVPSGGSLVVPIDSVAALKRWLNAEFYS